MNALYQQKLVINGQLTESAGVQNKVEQDIAFLKHRIELMQKQKAPNKIVIATYESMLKSRLSVLAWLQDGNNEETKP